MIRLECSWLDVIDGKHGKQWESDMMIIVFVGRMEGVVTGRFSSQSMGNAISPSRGLSAPILPDAQSDIRHGSDSTSIECARGEDRLGFPREIPPSRSELVGEREGLLRCV